MPFMHVFVCQQSEQCGWTGERARARRENSYNICLVVISLPFLLLLLLLLDSPTCSQTIQFPSQIFAGIHRPINLTCHMNNGNPASINFTWHLPDGHIRLGERINGTSSSITLIPRTANDFGRITCRAANALGLAGECDVNMTLGGE